MTLNDIDRQTLEKARQALYSYDPEQCADADYRIIEEVANPKWLWETMERYPTKSEAMTVGIRLGIILAEMGITSGADLTFQYTKDGEIADWDIKDA